VTHSAYIALGSNVASRWGTPVKTVRRAAEDLKKLGDVERISSLYITEPVGNTEQPVFVNAVLLLETSLTAEELLTRLLALELDFGRDRLTATPKGPRTLDLDLLFYDDVVLASPQLNLPHPELARRRFVLQPLAEIAPTLVHPILGVTIKKLLEDLPDAGPNRIDAVRRVA